MIFITQMVDQYSPPGKWQFQNAGHSTEMFNNRMSQLLLVSFTNLVWGSLLQWLVTASVISGVWSTKLVILEMSSFQQL